MGWATGFGAYRGFLYGGALGIFFANYVTYWVNAGCHLFGGQIELLTLARASLTDAFRLHLAQNLPHLVSRESSKCLRPHVSCNAEG